MNDNNAPQRKIDPCCNEHRSDGQGNEIPKEIVPVEGIIVHEHSRNVANSFSNETNRHGSGKAFGPMLHPEEDLGDGEDSHNGDEQGIAGHRWLVTDEAPFLYVACLEGANEALDIIIGRRHVDDCQLLYQELLGRSQTVNLLNILNSERCVRISKLGLEGR